MDFSPEEVTEKEISSERKPCGAIAGLNVPRKFRRVGLATLELRSRINLETHDTETIIIE